MSKCAMEITGERELGNDMRFFYKITFLIKPHFKLND